jgi:alanine racemase
MTEGPAFSRPAWVAVDLDAIRANVRALVAAAAPAAVLATVKADAYGHGAVPVARAAVDSGAAFLGVAFVEEGIELREAGIDAPIMLLSEPPPAAAPAVIAHRITPLVYTVNGIDELAKAVVDAGAPPHAVHLKVDTGMHRVGCAVPDAVALAEMIAARDELEFEGLATHLAVADEPDSPYTDAQLDAFDDVITAITARVGRPSILHAANSAGLLAHPRARYDLVRAGIALYGITPVDEPDTGLALRPALSLHARVSYVKQLDAGARVSYGLRYTLPRAARIATVPVGYADGVPRALGAVGGEVLVHGVRCPIAGTVTMDQLLVDVGALDVAVDDDVVLLGEQGGDEITADDWAARLDTIPYEVVTRLGGRLPRRYSS